jgi:ABC-2 type transport system permease protein
MAVYERAYRAYAGPLRPGAARRTVILRYALADVLANKKFVAWLVACIAFPIGCGLYLYAINNLDILKPLGISAAGVGMFTIGPRFFLNFLYIQGLIFAFLTTLFAGPGLISPDLRNNALPLYFSRPLTRSEYLLGKGAVLALVLSAMTWIPGLILWLFQAVLAGGSWWSDNLRLAPGIFFGSWLLIAVLALLALSVSALVKWKPLAGALIFAVFVGGRPFSLAINEILDTGWGLIFDINYLVQTAWTWMMGARITPEVGELPPWASFVMLAIVCAGCIVLLRRRVKAYEVVR